MFETREGEATSMKWRKYPHMCPRGPTADVISLTPAVGSLTMDSPIWKKTIQFKIIWLAVNTEPVYFKIQYFAQAKFHKK